jgi:hypothetical protein
MNSMLAPLTNALVAADPVPTENGTVAGWVGFAVFIGLAVAVGLLGWSLTRHLKKAKTNADAGAFGEVATNESGSPTTV